MTKSFASSQTFLSLVSQIQHVDTYPLLLSLSLVHGGRFSPPGTESPSADGGSNYSRDIVNPPVYGDCDEDVVVSVGRTTSGCDRPACIRPDVIVSPRPRRPQARGAFSTSWPSPVYTAEDCGMLFGVSYATSCLSLCILD